MNERIIGDEAQISSQHLELTYDEHETDGEQQEPAYDLDGFEIAFEKV